MVRQKDLSSPAFIVQSCGWDSPARSAFGLLSCFFLYFQDNVGKSFIEPAFLLVIISVFFLYRLKKGDNHRLFSYRACAECLGNPTGLSQAYRCSAHNVVTDISFTGLLYWINKRSNHYGATVHWLDDLPNLLDVSAILAMDGRFGCGRIFVSAVLPMLNVGGMRLLKAETAWSL